jgi:hypothetical protein
MVFHHDIIKSPRLAIAVVAVPSYFKSLVPQQQWYKQKEEVSSVMLFRRRQYTHLLAPKMR